jgi:hypothetical protein
MYDNINNLIEALILDLWPSQATIIDFGIESSDHLGALQWAYKYERVNKFQLNNLLGNGPELTKAICTKDNPYGDIVFRTAWDNLPEEEE